MKKTAHKINPTTQQFIGIQDIFEDVVILPGKSACLVLEVIATNFSLQSKEEQESKIYSYASLLNSLSFQIQVVIISRKLDITRYVHMLDDEAKKTKNSKLAEQISLYKDFVADLVKVNTVLDKKFYIIVSYSFLEKAGSVTGTKDQSAFALEARNSLQSKASSVIQELLRIGLKANILNKNELLKVYYEIFNSENGGASLTHEVNSLMVKGAQ